MFNEYNAYGDIRLCSRSERSNSVNIWDVFQIEGMLKVFDNLGMVAVLERTNMSDVESR